MTYEDTAKYLRSNSILIDGNKYAKPPSRLMNVEDTNKKDYKSQKNMEQVVKLFYTMAENNGYKNTYNMFNTKSFRDSLMILTALRK